MTRELPLERYFHDARGGLFQPPQDDLALGAIGRVALATKKRERNIPHTGHVGVLASGNAGRQV